jgi:hypothetical protein
MMSEVYFWAPVVWIAFLCALTCWSLWVADTYRSRWVMERQRRIALQNARNSV